MTIAPHGERALRLHVRVRPTWRTVDVLRSAVLDCVAPLTDDARAEALGMVAAELVENAIKYGDFREPDAALLELRVASDASAIEIAVSNPTRDGAEGSTALERMLAWIGSFPSAEEAYYARMEQVLQGSDESGSRMGLVRIAHEGRCAVAATRGADGRSIVVRATAPRA